MALILSFFFILNSTYSDLTVDSKNRILLLSSTDRTVVDNGGSVYFSLDLIYAPLSISASPFSIWVTSASEFTSQKYSLWGELVGEIKAGGNDIDADEKGILIAGEPSYLFQAVSGAKITVTKKEMKRSALSKDSLYLYGEDTLFVFKRNGKLIRKEFIPGIKDLCVFNKRVGFLFSDSLLLSDTTLSISGGQRVESNYKFIAVLTDSGIVYFHPPELTSHEIY